MAGDTVRTDGESAGDDALRQAVVLTLNSGEHEANRLLRPFICAIV